MLAWLNRLKEKAWVAHLLRANERFTMRLGVQFGAAITYFSVLALVPLLMLAFSVTGFVLVVVRPDLLGAVANAAADAVGSTDQETRAKIFDVISNALQHYTSIGVVALLAALYSGAGWMGNLKNAVRAQWRKHFDLQGAPGNPVVTILVNLATLLGLLVAIAVTFGLAALSTNLTDTVIGWLGLDNLRWLSPVLTLVPIAFSVGAGWLLFMFLYSVLPETREPWPIVRRGALIGSIGLVALQYLTGILVGAFDNNPAAKVFGPVIILMLFFNLFALLILFVAAWIATADHEAVPASGDEVKETVRFPLHTVDGREAGMVSQELAAQSVRVGIGTGYVTGAATGVGIGAVLAVIAARFSRKHR